jgi:hypothetical protein
MNKRNSTEITRRRRNMCRVLHDFSHQINDQVQEDCSLHTSRNLFGAYKTCKAIGAFRYSSLFRYMEDVLESFELVEQSPGPQTCCSRHPILSKCRSISTVFDSRHRSGTIGKMSFRTRTVHSEGGVCFGWTASCSMK